jgi:hypothetical protein
MNQLGLGFKTFDQVIKTTGIGALVLLFVTLVAAVIDAAKKSQALTDAFAVFGDAIGALFDALKPLTDFLINVFVGALNLVADALNGIASLFGGINKGYKQMSAALEVEINKQKAILDNFSAALSQNLQDRLKLQQDYLTKKKAILDAEYKDEADRQRDLFLLQLNAASARSDQQMKEAIDLENHNVEVRKIKADAIVTGYKDQRKAAEANLLNQELFNHDEIRVLKIQNGLKMQVTKIHLEAVKKSHIKDREEIIKDLEATLKDFENLDKFYKEKEVANTRKSDADAKKLRQQFYREDIAAINERNNQILQLTTELIKEENARNLKAAQDALVILKEQHRKELEDASITGITLKNLREKQIAENKAANEKIRLAQIQYDAYLIQLEIDKQNRLVTEVGIGTEEYFKARRDIAEQELLKELKLADNDANKVANARTAYWKKLIDIDKEALQERVNLLTAQYDGIYEGTKAAFDKQRELEDAQYKLRQADARGNYEMLEALSIDHNKKMAMIDSAELQAKSDVELRKANTLSNLTQEYYDGLRLAQDENTQAQLIAAGDNEEKQLAIRYEYVQKQLEIDALEVENQQNLWKAKVAIAADFGNVLNTIASALMADAQGRDKEQFERAKGLAKAAVVIQKAAAIAEIVANTAIANAKAVAAFWMTGGQPWVTINTVAAGVSIAGVIAAGAAQLAQINQTEFQQSAGSSGGTGGNSLGRNYGDGGMIDGPRHAAGGVMINAEGGEAVMTRGAVTMFAPLLSAMNQMGGGVSFSPNVSGILPDNPIVSNPSLEQQPSIIKTYVVSSELTSTAERQARLKDLSTL